ncbi:hypothetical protein AMTR_s00028p00241530 [Amborella trichopoda]|uniref:Uncharacterized protein n=1 Tax=Amborella trichopoda TaxID=13333 RepID=W1PS95_AMBTC|nr:hypothetical protein AMTR_s00028p00241530 [Amborella trichopoda]
MKQIHTKKRNKLEQKRLNDLVFVQYNQKLKEHHLDWFQIEDPILVKELDPTSEWLVKPNVGYEHEGEGSDLGKGKGEGEEEGADKDEDDDHGGRGGCKLTEDKIQVDFMPDVDLVLLVMMKLKLIIEFIISVG